MKILIAGGTGFIGTHLARWLETEGHTLSLLSRKRGPGLIVWDAVHAGAWEQSLEGTDAVINLTGESVGAGRWTTLQKERIRNSRIEATRAIVEAIRKAAKKPQVMINASAVGYYGHVEDGDVKEDAPAGNDFLGQTCRVWESEARKAEQWGVRVVLMRTGFVLGSDSDAFKKMQLPFKLFVGGPFGSGKQWFPWIHIDDVAAGYAFAIGQSALSGPVNLSAPNPVRVRDLARELGRALHRPSFMPAPAFALKIALGEMSDLLLKGQKMIPVKLLQHGFAFRFPELPAALSDAVE
ncbi:MAG: TIGR01777 family oxidoreductase [Bacteroidota bacterium]